MRQPRRASHKALFDEVYADPQRAAMATEHTLTVADETFLAEDLRSFSRSSSQTGEGKGAGAARAIAGKFTSPLSARHEGRRVRVMTYVEGVPFPSYVGWCLTRENDSEAGYSFGGSTSGYWQNGDDAVRFNAQTSYPSWPPSYAAWDMMRRLPYDRIAIPSVERPEFDRTGSDAFSPLAAIGEGLGAIEEMCGLTFRDNAVDWGMGYVRPTLAAPTPPVASWRLGEHLSSLKARRKNAARFRDVAIVRQLQSGEYVDLVKPRPEVRYAPGVAPPPVGTTYYELIPEDEVEDPAADFYFGAESRAFVLVQTLGMGTFDMEVSTVFFDPRVEDYDIIECVEEDHATGIYYRYRMLIESSDSDHGASAATYRGTGALVEMREPALLRVPARRRSAGVIRSAPRTDSHLYPGLLVYPGVEVYPS